MIYTESIRVLVFGGMGAVARELHETAQAVTDDIMRYRSIPLKCPYFEDGRKRIKTCDLKQIYPELCTSSISFQRPQIRRAECCSGRFP